MYSQYRNIVLNIVIMGIGMLDIVIMIIIFMMVIIINDNITNLKVLKYSSGEE